MGRGGARPASGGNCRPSFHAQAARVWGTAAVKAAARVDRPPGGLGRRTAKDAGGDTQNESAAFSRRIDGREDGRGNSPAALGRLSARSPDRAAKPPHGE